MTGPLRTKPVVDPGEDVQFSETAGEPLEWQRELDVAIADIDSRLKHPRRKATAVQSTLPHAGPEITSEAIDEIAWRVAELLRRNGSGPVQPGAMAEAISKTVAAPPAGCRWRAGADASAASRCRRWRHRAHAATQAVLPLVH